MWHTSPWELCATWHTIPWELCAINLHSAAGKDGTLDVLLERCSRLVEGSSFEILEDGTLCEALAVAHGIGKLDFAGI